jgi:hypothetical protein
MILVYLLIKWFAQRRTFFLQEARISKMLVGSWSGQFETIYASIYEN